MGPETARSLRALGLSNVGRLLAHLPLRHELHAAEAPIAQLVPGQIVSARGQITATRVVRGRKPRLEAVLFDDSARLDLVWFNMTFLRDKLPIGARVRVQGTLQRRGPGIQIVNPRLEVLDPNDHEPPARHERLRPVYPASESLPSWRIERAVRAILPHALPLLEDHLPDAYRSARNLPSLADAYRMQHAPQSHAEVAASRRRLAYDELLLLQLAVHMKRAHRRRACTAPALRSSEALDQHIRARFPFSLTPAQDRVVRDVAADLAQPFPANRLIQGDVGSGKTLVALYAMLLAVAAQKQAALVAPTALLAEQHFSSITRILEGSRVRVGLLLGSMPAPQRDELAARARDGSVDLLIGTHALLLDDLQFRDLAVVVIDEQHRFGVSQRGAFRSRAHAGKLPHQLVMTATPIPRTLALSLFGDLDVSTIDQLPPGRAPVETRVLPSRERAELYAGVRGVISRGEQGFIVAPAIDPSTIEGDAPGATTRRNVRDLLAELGEGPLMGARLAAMHGRVPREQREEIMRRFHAGEVDALVATSVVEVGVDVPNATFMVVEDADQFGLAQLHQLRGRVGRGSKPSLCALVGDPSTEEGTRRLEIMGTTTDGFALAEKDLELRGPGEVFGLRQSGLAPFRVADLMRDRDLLGLARRDAHEWVERSPALAGDGEALLRRRLLKSHGEWFGLGDVG